MASNKNNFKIDIDKNIKNINYIKNYIYTIYDTKRVFMDTTFLTPKSLAARWNVNCNTLSQWRWNGKGPRYLKMGSRILYHRQDIEMFEVQRIRYSTSQSNKRNDTIHRDFLQKL